MKDIYYDAEGDILTVNFPHAKVKKETGLEIADTIVLYFDTVEEKPLQMIFICYNRLVQYSRRKPIVLDKLASYPKRLQRLVLKLIQQAPVSNFLEVKALDKDSRHTVRVKKLVLEPKLLEAA
ncbi:hypothetical protein EDS67_01515 [candidate division KSB1 bacterium]|nr:MAG: hypothetical protein EDS67_01515 [candidate division KSB1 bacterium]MBC6948518.1 hypothetical protein [candidate division KSB1 bacterium]MCE7940407.1 hypothetical protein [Chlorobi bacterium CHB1]MDL1875573.1 hypothetical protein [Cytophagia bacterium CHB2]